MFCRYVAKVYTKQDNSQKLAHCEFKLNQLIIIFIQFMVIKNEGDKTRVTTQNDDSLSLHLQSFMFIKVA